MSFGPEEKQRRGVMLGREYWFLWVKRGKDALVRVLGCWELGLKGLVDL